MDQRAVTAAKKTGLIRSPPRHGTLNGFCRFTRRIKIPVITKLSCNRAHKKSSILPLPHTSAPDLRQRLRNSPARTNVRYPAFWTEQGRSNERPCSAFIVCEKPFSMCQKEKAEDWGDPLLLCENRLGERFSLLLGDNGVVTSPDSDTRRGQNNRNNILSISDFFLCVNENFSTVQSIRMEISKHLTECVSAPRDIMSTPHSATFRMFSGVTLPDASKSALPFVRRTASFMVS